MSSGTTKQNHNDSDNGQPVDLNQKLYDRVTIGDLMERIPPKDKFLERWKRGDVCDTVVDLERTALSQEFAKGTAIGAVIADPLTRTIIHRHKRQVAISDNTVMGAIPSLITDRRVETFKDGMREDLAAGELYDLVTNATAYIADHYRRYDEWIAAYNASQDEKDRLPLPPAANDKGKKELHYFHESNSRTKEDRRNRVKKPRQTRVEKDAVFVPVRNEDGDIVYDFAISGNGKHAYYKEGEKWFRVEKAKKTVIMQNARADNNWIWTDNHQYLLPEQFITHTKFNNAYQVDTLPLYREANQLGAWEGREKFILPTRHDAVWGPVPTASKGPVVKANTRLENMRLGIRAGIEFDDHSHHDESRDHDELDDCEIELAAYWYIQDICPELVEFKKFMADTDDAVRFLLPQNGPPPIFSFVPARDLRLGKKMGMVVNTDRAYGDFKRAVAITLTSLQTNAEDPLTLRLPDGRNIADLTTENWQNIIWNDENSQNATSRVIETFRLNKNPMIQSAEAGMKSGANHNISYEELQKRRDRIHAMPHIRDRIMEAFAEHLKTVRRIPHEEWPDPQNNDYRFNGIGEPQRANIIRPDRDKKAQDAVNRAIDARAKSKLDFYRDRNRYVRTIIRPNLALEGDKKAGIEPEPEAYQTFEKTVNETLGKYHRKIRGNRLKDLSTHGREDNHFKWPQKVTFKSNDDAQKFLWKMRERALKENWLVDAVTDHYWVYDRATGDEITTQTLQNVEIDEFNRLFDIQKGRWNIEFEPLDYSRQFIAEIFLRSEKEKELYDIDPDWKTWATARRVLTHEGAPFRGPDNQRFPTNDSELLLLESIRRNEMRETLIRRHLSTDPDISGGLYEQFIESVPGKQKQIQELIDYYKSNKRRFRWTKELLDAAGYDPVTKRPHEKIVYPIAKKDFNAATKIGIPYHTPLQPIQHQDNRFRPVMYAVPETPQIKQLWQKGKLANCANRLFKCSDTGQHFFAANTAIHRIIPAEDPSLRYIWQQASRIFEDSGINDYSADQPVYLIEAESMEPVAGAHQIEMVTDIPVPGEHRFLSTIAPKLAGYRLDKIDRRYKKPPPLRGLVVPDYEYTKERGYNLSKGEKIRLRETHNETGRETGREVSATLSEDAQFWTLQEFEEQYAADKITDRFAKDYGFADARRMYAEIAGWFTALQRPKDSEKNRIMLIRFNKTSDVVYFKPSEVPRAGVIETYNKTKRDMYDRWGTLAVLNAE